MPAQKNIKRGKKREKAIGRVKIQARDAVDGEAQSHFAQAVWFHCVASFLLGVLGGFEEDVLRSVAFVLRMIIHLLVLALLFC